MSNSNLNITNILKLADVIEALDTDRFTMTAWYQVNGGNIGTITAKDFQHNCGTAACIGGWADVVFASDPNDTIMELMEGGSVEALGLTQDQADALFCPPGYDLLGPYNPYTQAEAVWTLRNLAETGEVKWRVTPNA